MTVKVYPSKLAGSFSAPPSKSAAHRAVICAGLAQGHSTVSNLVLSQDITATIGAMRSLGANVKLEDNRAEIDGVTATEPYAEIDCHESGSTLRFMLPVAAALGCRSTFLGSGRLPSRPLGALAQELMRHGIIFDTTTGMPFHIEGKLSGGEFSLPGDISSQFISGLLLALPLTGQAGAIHLTTPLQSAGYVDMTMEMMRRFGVDVMSSDDGFSLPGGQTYRPCDVTVEGDYSNAAFFLCAGALGSNISCRGLLPDSLQGDRAILDVLRAFGSHIEESGRVDITPQRLRAISLDVSEIPDLVPILAVTAAFAEGTTLLYNAARLRIKESDRLSAMAENLRILGASVTEYHDRLKITGKPELSGGQVDGFGDHRIVMAMTIAALGCRDSVTITGCEAVNKSYPQFFDDFKRLGGVFDII